MLLLKKRSILTIIISLYVTNALMANPITQLLHTVKTGTVKHAKTEKWPIVYHPQYNISLLAGLEQYLHPFDGAKYGKIAHHLCTCFGITKDAFHKPDKITEGALETVHSKSYLASLKNSSTVAHIAEIPLSWIPNWLLQRKILDPMRYATQGTIEATRIALQQGIGINLSGGYHHARTEHQQGGFCFFADIPLAVATIRKEYPSCQKIVVVDLDAHRGNGIAQVRHHMNDHNTYLFDMYSEPNYPYALDKEFLRTTDMAIPVKHGINDADYLTLLKTNLEIMINTIQPNLIIFNAGSDIYEGDQLGRMGVSAEGIKQRDAHVFHVARSKNIPIVMTLSGGYSKESAAIVGSSIEQILRTHYRATPPQE